MRAHILLFTVVLVLLFVGSLSAAEVVEEKKPAIGAFGLYAFVPDGFMEFGYSEYASISGAGYGVWTSYGFGAYDLLGRISNWTLFIDDAYWKTSGGTNEDRFYVEPDLGMVALDMSILWKWRVHEAVEPYVGPTLGLGFLYGDLNVYEVDTDTGKKVDDPQDKQIPPVVPTAGFMGGCRFYPDPHFRLSVDLGFYNGLFAGISAGYAF